MLTPKLKNLLEYLACYIKKHGYAPTYEQMADAMLLSSKSGIARMVVVLEKRGYIRRIPNSARAIEIINKEPPSYNDIPTNSKGVYYKGISIKQLNRDELLEILTRLLDGFRTN